MSLIPSSALFSFEIPCRPLTKVWDPTGRMELPPRYLIPNFSALHGQKTYAELRMGWSRHGIGFSLRVEGKSRVPWCRQSRLTASEGLMLWIHTRDTHAIHRANRFCHLFCFLPAGRGQRMDQPVAEQLPIQRATANPNSLPAGALQVRSECSTKDYRMRGSIPAVAMTGFDPAEHRRLGFFFAIVDDELGLQSLSLSADYPFTNDPSLWGTLVLED